MLLTEFVSGSIFGAALLAAGVYAPSVIKAQMAFSSNVMVTVMMGASASSAYAGMHVKDSPGTDMLQNHL